MVFVKFVYYGHNTFQIHMKKERKYNINNVPQQFTVIPTR